ncbi:DUF6094 domain-containing protein [Aneurinibacillus thermoaerophilus]|uniref:DUF6094 domain-containing protein n=1 Tax=Aneurinibacillus thermoaerophilus TaxID=143495 RepID=UPI002E2249DE|nr:DUF6094 domain-containing protein [Aneurinibacillus thermoaerophilus]
MARIASQSKGGYYPTPVIEMERVLRRLTFQSMENNLLNLIDPCAGEGEALQMLTQHFQSLGAEAVSYAVELEAGRAEKAKEKVNYVVHDGYERMRTEAKFSAIWLNPPYDEVLGERMEVTFLRDLTGWKNVLQKGALLMYCVPQYVLKDAAGLLSSRFRNIHVYRFDDEHYPVFRQVVLFATFERETDQKKKREIAKWLREIGESDPNVLPTLDADDGVVFSVKPSDEQITLFRAGVENIEELKKDLGSSPLLTIEAEKLFRKDSHRSAEMKNPLLPLKPTHYGIAIAAGAVGGNMGDHLISGLTKMRIDKKQNFNEDGKLVSEEFTKHYTSVVRVFSPQGVFDLE